MDAKRVLKLIGEEVSNDFAKKRSILTFEEYVHLFLQNPRQQARGAAEYLRDAMLFFGTEEVPHPSGQIRRFKLFDHTDGDRDGRVAGQEEVQNAIFRSLGNFVRAGRVNRLLFLHGPNGSAKSSIIDALKRALEQYSHQPDGALYRIAWVFPSQRLVKGSIGFGDKPSSSPDASSYARLPPEDIEVRLTCEMRDHPILLVPREERRKFLEKAWSDISEEEIRVWADYVVDGELCHKCRSVFNGLLSAHQGDYVQVLRHVQVERFYVSRRYQVAAAKVEPQMSVDASYRQVTADRSSLNLPGSLQNLSLFEPHGPLVSANRGLIEYSDLLKRPLETYKYLLGASETAEVPLEHFIMQLDEVLIASSNEKHLAAFKELPDFASFKGRIELIRVPYLRQYRVEQQIYDAQITPLTVGKHVAPHATEVAAMWAVLTRLKKPISERYSSNVRDLIDRLTPVEKLRAYDEGIAPEKLSLAQVKEFKSHLEALFNESDAYPNYEGRSGASAREIKTALFNSAQNADYSCLHPIAVFNELSAICKDKSIYEFLQQEVVDGYHQHEAYIQSVEEEYLNSVDHEFRESMGLVVESQYNELFERYIQHVSHWTKGEKIKNRLTGEMEPPDEKRMVELETIVMPKGEVVAEFRRGLISTIGAHKLENPDAQMDYRRIFPELIRKLRDHFFQERQRVLHKNKENILKFLSEDRGMLSAKEQTQVQDTLGNLAKKYGYCNHCAKDALVFLMRRRYA